MNWLFSVHLFPYEYSHRTLTPDGVHRLLPELRQPVPAEVELLQRGEVREGPGGHPPQAAGGEVQGDQLGDHLEGVRLHLLEGVPVQAEVAQEGDV